jgi:hypothetical protein
MPEMKRGPVTEFDRSMGFLERVPESAERKRWRPSA